MKWLETLGAVLILLLVGCAWAMISLGESLLGWWRSLWLPSESHWDCAQAHDGEWQGADLVCRKCCLVLTPSYTRKMQALAFDHIREDEVRHLAQMERARLLQAYEESR